MIDWSHYMPAVIGLLGVVVGGVLTFGMQARERRLNRLATIRTEVAEVVILSTAIQEGLQTIHMPAVEYKLSKEQIESVIPQVTGEWLSARSKLIRLSHTADKATKQAADQLLLSLKTATNYLDPHSRPGLKTDFECADDVLHDLESCANALSDVSQALPIRRHMVLKKHQKIRELESR
ncbi:hypothetical protein [Glutamicibacter protophormiae]|uniref:hypothetical protein n=1 Tax=Glutamicibacter protophormiae TaxID=37930 RepID=UPI00195B53EF|nr:hypothetical protein [Glutamicibacter protophormiae]QRQ79326.1 hypothetical protein JQN66_03610 [Glutamicibacter protophormiae]